MTKLTMKQRKLWWKVVEARNKAYEKYPNYCRDSSGEHKDSPEADAWGEAGRQLIKASPGIGVTWRDDGCSFGDLKLKYGDPL